MRAKGPGRRGRSPVVAIVAAAGEGRRAGRGVPKQFRRAGGRSLLEHALSRLEAHEDVDAIVVVVPPARVREVEALRRRHPKIAAVVAGGARRQDSVALGLDSAPARSSRIVLVHDAARPMVPHGVISAVIREARRSGAAVPGVPPADTVKLVGGDGRVARTLPRERLRLIQTPQGFRSEWLRRAFRRARAGGNDATDDASLVEAAGLPVSVVDGDEGNFKVTTGGDVARLRSLLRRRKRGAARRA